MTPVLVILGNLLVDDIVMPDGRTLMGEPGGAMLYASLAARLWGARVGLVSIAGSDYPQAALDALAARGIDTSGVTPLGRPGVRSWLLYEPVMRRIIHRLDSASHFDVSPVFDDIPADFLKALAFHIAPMPIDRQREIAAGIAAVRPDAFVSLDPHETVRDDNRAVWGTVLDHVDAFFPSHEEVRLAEVEADPRGALVHIPGRRVSIIAYKCGPEGGILIERPTGRIIEWRAGRAPVVDATGAGDGFAGGFVAGWLSHGDVDRAIEQGVVTASFAIEDWGAGALMRATPESVEARRRDWSELAGRTGGV